VSISGLITSDVWMMSHLGIFSETLRHSPNLRRRQEEFQRSRRTAFYLVTPLYNFICPNSATILLRYRTTTTLLEPLSNRRPRAQGISHLVCSYRRASMSGFWDRPQATTEVATTFESASASSQRGQGHDRIHADDSIHTRSPTMAMSAGDLVAQDITAAQKMMSAMSGSILTSLTSMQTLIFYQTLLILISQ
jgi:hypothetical protein